jgi:hypothetical protein
VVTDIGPQHLIPKLPYPHPEGKTSIQNRMQLTYLNYRAAEPIGMNTLQQVTVFDDPEMLREAITGLCRDKLPRQSDPAEAKLRDSVLEDICWHTFPLQGKYFPFQTLVEKCQAIIGQSGYAPLAAVSAKDFAIEISTPVGGW